MGKLLLEQEALPTWGVRKHSAPAQTTSRIMSWTGDSGADLDCRRDPRLRATDFRYTEEPLLLEFFEPATKNGISLPFANQDVGGG